VKGYFIVKNNKKLLPKNGKIVQSLLKTQPFFDKTLDKV